MTAPACWRGDVRRYGRWALCLAWALQGRDYPPYLTAYRAQINNPKMAVKLGSRQSVVHLPPLGVIRSPLLTRKTKAEHMLVPKYRRLLKVD